MYLCTIKQKFYINVLINLIITMKQEEIRSNFNFSYAQLTQLGDKAERLILRDLKDLKLYGVNVNTAENIAAQTLAFKQYPTDYELVGLVSEATKYKDKTRDEMHTIISSIMIRVKNKFGIGSPTYKRFGASDLSNKSDEEMVHATRRVVRLATEYLPSLAEKGLTQTIIDNLNTILLSFDNSLDSKESSVEDRDESTQERIILANTLYSQIAEIFDYGKEYYYTRDEAKYNDYIIYDNPTSNLPDDTNLPENTPT